jgi:membrane protein DedA with SNARE-associated domain
MALVAFVFGAAGFVLARVSEASATEGVIVASIVVPVLILAIVGWFFWRASNRDRKTNTP